MRVRNKWIECRRKSDTHTQRGTERVSERENDTHGTSVQHLFFFPSFLPHYQSLCPKGQNFPLFFPATFLLTETGKELLEAVEAVSLQTRGAADISEFDTLTTDDEDN